MRRRFLLVFAAILILPGRLVTGAESLSLSPSPSTPRAKVVVVHDPLATVAFEPRADRVLAMVSRGITNLTGKATVEEAWASLVSSNDTVGIKVYTAPGLNTGTRPDVVAAVVQGLLAAGIPTNHIIVWDRRRAELRGAGYGKLAQRFGIEIAGAVDAGFDEKTFYETALLGNLIFGDLEFGKKGEGVGRKSFVTKIITQRITKIINIAPVLNHNGAGVTGNLFSLAMGSVDNTVRFQSDPARLAIAVPEIYALPALFDRVVLSISDALICQYEGEDRSLLHYSTELNEIRFSHDPVALDVLALQDLDRIRRERKQSEPPVNWELYRNAALLELGVANPKQIDITTLGPTATSTGRIPPGSQGR